MFKTLAIASVVAFCLSGVASATTFTLDTGGGDGTGIDSGPGSGYDFNLGMTGNDNGSPGPVPIDSLDGIYTTWTSIAGATAEHISGVWEYSTIDTFQGNDGSSWDIFGYFIGTFFDQLSSNDLAAPATHGGLFDFDVGAGQSYGFYIYSVDGQFGAASATISGNVSPIPLPAAGLLLLGALGGLAAFRRRKTA